MDSIIQYSKQIAELGLTVFLLLVVAGLVYYIWTLQKGNSEKLISAIEGLTAATTQTNALNSQKDHFIQDVLMKHIETSSSAIGELQATTSEIKRDLGDLKISFLAAGIKSFGDSKSFQDSKNG
jgi:hypothetical protein